MTRPAHHPTGTPAIVELVAHGIEHTVHPYLHDAAATNYGEEAAAALGIDPGRIFKTLVVDDAGTLAVAVVPVSSQLDLKAAARALGGKRLTLAVQQQAERSSGYVAGGISPIGQRKPLRTVIDSSAFDWSTVYVSAGRRGLQVELAPTALVAVTGAITAPIAR